MKRINAYQCVLAALAAIACSGGEGTEGTTSPQVLLEQLPAEPQARADALDRLATDYPEDPQVIQAVREFAAQQVQGLSRTVDFDGGRSVTFSVVGDSVIVAQSGPSDIQSIVAERGLEGLSPAELWQRLLPDEPVPEVLADGGAAQTDGVAAPPLTSQTSELGGTAPSTTGTDAIAPGASDEVGVIRQAYSTSPDDFASYHGGCSTSPTLGGSPYPNVVGYYCLSNAYTGHVWTAYNSGQARWRVDSVSGGFYVNIYRNGVLKFQSWLNSGYWINIHAFATHKKQPNVCCGWLIPGVLCGAWCSQPDTYAVEYLRLETSSDSGDTMRVGGIYFNDVWDTRTDTQPFNRH